jgi:hypothetical protein
MENVKNKNQFWTIVLYASIWGLLEATLGWLLQFVPFPISGLVMFPLALFPSD